MPPIAIACVALVALPTLVRDEALPAVRAATTPELFRVQATGSLGVSGTPAMPGTPDRTTTRILSDQTDTFLVDFDGLPGSRRAR